jgi:hypothetical protein
MNLINVKIMNIEQNSDNSEKALHRGSINYRLSKADKEELQKCKDSPVYFYNKYVRKDGEKELTEAEYENYVKQLEYQRNMPLKLRKHYQDRPLTPDQCYEKLPDFLKNGG